MELKIKKKAVRLRTIFIRYLLLFCFGTICWALILIFSYSAVVSSGMLYPANYAEQKIEEAKGIIAQSDIVTSEMIPGLCDYAVYTMDGKKLSGNLNRTASLKAWREVLTGETGQDLFYHYIKIPRKNQACIIRYSLSPQYKLPALRKYLPEIEPLTFLIFILGFISGTLILGSAFGKKLTEKMNSLKNATEKIQNQDLDFTVESSGVAEIDNVLQSMDKMKEALKSSLKKQWNLEQTRREQISALAHDIKTPITVVRGNADLLKETSQTDEQKEYTAYIEESTCQMEEYIKTLIEISKAEIGYSLNIEPIDSKSFIDNIRGQVAALAAVKKLTFNFKAHNLPETFSADNNLLQRAILNVASNAIEFSMENSQIIFNVEEEQNFIQFCIIDFGKGFSKNDLKEASRQFYMGDKSRTSKFHYGMGLFIAKSIAEQHGGAITIANSEVTGGGQVTIIIPINCSIN